MNMVGHLIENTPVSIMSGAGSEIKWYAIRTRSRHEKVAARELDSHGIPVFLPLVTSVRQWSDRRTHIELPLFPGYAFVRIDYLSGDRVRVLRAIGVVDFVGHKSDGSSIPDEQIESIRTVIAQSAGKRSRFLERRSAYPSSHWGSQRCGRHPGSTERFTHAGDNRRAHTAFALH